MPTAIRPLRSTAPSLGAAARRAALLLVAACVANVTHAPCAAQDRGAQSPADAQPAPLTADPLPDGTAAATKFLAGLRVPAGIEIRLFAAEPQLGNPVAIGLDEQGRVYVAEQYRFNRGTEENRTRPFLLEDDLQIRTLDDRLAMYRRHAKEFEGGLDWFSRWTDQVRQLRDADGDGRADRSTVFASGFNGPLDGLAAGVLARDGDVFLTCIPSLYRLRDDDDDGIAETRQVVHAGFGVNAAFLGHDLHGLCFGPDGRLYFSVGDRGFHVTTREGRTLSGPRTGAVFRCEPDGSQLEVVHRGLRNPQELAFDKHGNLFAADNNCDKGDHSRLVYVVEGGDSGWNMAYQTIPAPYLTGPWHAERTWNLANDEQPASIVPPVGALGAGPSGFAYDPGTGLPDRWRDRFFLCNYTGNGGLESFGLEPRGAGFEIVDPQDFLKPLKATDVEFGPDGRMYVSDYVNLVWGGGSLGGRIYTLRDPAKDADPARLRLAALFREGVAKKNSDELEALLAHADQRIRLRAQWELAKRGAESVPRFVRAARSSTDRLARLHGIWGLGQLARRDSATLLEPLVPLLDDPDAEVRCQTLKTIGDVRWAGPAERLVRALTDPELRVRFFAAQALGRIGHVPAVAPLVTVLRENADKDRQLRHAVVYALVSLAERGALDAIVAHADDADRAVRLGVLLVLRRRADARIARFLRDADPWLVTEAARAIHDVPIDEASADLAAAVDRIRGPHAVRPVPEALARRAIDARFRRGTSDDLAAIADLVTDESAPAFARREALAALAAWSTPGPRDRVTGFWRPLPARDANAVRATLSTKVETLLARSAPEIQGDVVDLVLKQNLAVQDEPFATWAVDKSRTPEARSGSLRLLAARKSPRFAELARTVLDDPLPTLRAQARELLALREPAAGLALLKEVLDRSESETVERQRALAVLARLGRSEADAELAAWMDRLARDEVEPRLRLDVLEAARARNVPALQKQVKDFDAKATAGGDLMAPFRIALEGGDARRGRDVFVNHRTGQCIRCHKMDGQGGDAGPDLAQLAVRTPVRTREHVLESLVLPDAKIAPGFGSIAVVLTSGRIVAGTLKSEENGVLKIARPDGTIESVQAADVEDRSVPKSAMPPMNRGLSASEMRDVIEYLAGPRK